MQFWPPADAAGMCPRCAASTVTVPKPGLGWLLPLVVFCWLCGILALVYAVLT